MTTRVCPYDIGCEPSPSVPVETVLQDGWCTFLLFFAFSKEYHYLGVAVVACRGCAMSKFGYPNDEGEPEHPLYNFGMAGATTAVLEVIESPWAAEVFQQKLASARRIWGERGMDWEWAKNQICRHFIVTMKEATFECIPSSLVVEGFFTTFDEAIAHVIRKFKEH
jgi:hypothetical protein